MAGGGGDSISPQSSPQLTSHHTQLGDKARPTPVPFQALTKTPKAAARGRRKQTPSPPKKKPPPTLWGLPGAPSALSSRIPRPAVGCLLIIHLLSTPRKNSQILPGVNNAPHFALPDWPPPALCRALTLSLHLCTQRPTV